MTRTVGPKRTTAGEFTERTRYGGLIRGITTRMLAEIWPLFPDPSVSSSAPLSGHHRHPPPSPTTNDSRIAASQRPICPPKQRHACYEVR